MTHRASGSLLASRTSFAHFVEMLRRPQRAYEVCLAPRMPFRTKTFCRAASREATLKTVQLGRSDLYVSEVSLGCMLFGSQNTKEESFAILDAAYNRGINFFDTSEYYAIPPSPENVGLSSECLGSWLKHRRIKREDVILATKVAGYSEADDMGFIAANRTVPPSKRRDLRLDAKSIEEAADGELRRLAVDHIDLFYTHWPDRSGLLSLGCIASRWCLDIYREWDKYRTIRVKSVRASRLKSR